MVVVEEREKKIICTMKRNCVNIRKFAVHLHDLGVCVYLHNFTKADAVVFWVQTHFAFYTFLHSSCSYN